MHNPFLVHFHMQLTWLNWSRARFRSFWSRSHDRFLVSISVSHSLVSVLALVSLCSGLINKPGPEDRVWCVGHQQAIAHKLRMGWIDPSYVFIFRTIVHIKIRKKTRCSAIAERPRCRVRYSFLQKYKTGTGRWYFTDIIGLSSTTVI